MARAFDPGCKNDNVPILEGVQGTGKSTLVQSLCPRREWFFDSDLQIGDKDAPQALAGKWIVELSEMHALARADVAKMKAFVTRATDTYRPSFGRVAKDFPRRWVAIGTTNGDRYLTDPTGNRRWWPLKTGRLDIEALRRDRDQLWAEAVVRYEQHEPWHVDSMELASLCEAEQDERTQGDPWDEAIAEWLAHPERRIELARAGYTTTARVLAGALSIEPGRWTRADEMRAAEALTRLGWTKGARRRVQGGFVRPYIAPLRELGTGGHDVGTSAKDAEVSSCSIRTYPITHTHKGDHSDQGLREEGGIRSDRLDRGAS